MQKVKTQEVKTHLFMLITIFLSLIIIIIFSGCDIGGDAGGNSGGDGDGVNDTTAPTVSSITPADGSTKVLINTMISVIFNEAIDTSTLTPDTFTLNPSTTGAVSYEADTYTATFTPLSSLVPGTVYTAMVIKDITDSAGNLLGADRTWSFTTEEFIYRVSITSDGTQSTGSDSYNVSINSDGQYVVFDSGATNLVAGDTNEVFDIFIHDTGTGTTTRVSVDSSGTQTGGVSYRPSISPDGRYVAFESLATNLVENDTNALSDVFIHDTETGTTARVSVDSDGAQGTGGGSYNSNSSISSDGRYVAFFSDATNLATSDTNGATDVFIHDTGTGTTTRVSVDSSGTQSSSGGNSSFPSISSDGRYVAFYSDATNLVSGDTNGVSDVFIHDTQTSTTTRVSVDSSGAQSSSGGGSALPSISSDGRYVAFESLATNLVENDTNVLSDVFIHDTETGTTARVSVDSDGAQGHRRRQLLSLYKL